MIAQTWTREDVRTTRLLAIDPSSGLIEDRTVVDLVDYFRAGDLIVVNDAATFPASLHGRTSSGAMIEARLINENADRTWRAVLFGAGDWRTRTEDRPLPPRIRVGETIAFGELHATMRAVDPESPRLVVIEWLERGDAFWRALYRTAKPVQYAHTAKPLAIWNTQTSYAARPWCAEAPSAGFAFSWELLLEVRRRGIGLARVTHAAGISSTGDAALDARLPLAERFEITDEAASAIAKAKAHGGRVLAIGTTTTRALEGAAIANNGELVASKGTTEFLLGPRTTRRVVDAIVTGVHDVATSHFTLLESFAPRVLLERAHSYAASRGYTSHEFGDAILVLPPREYTAVAIAGRATRAPAESPRVAFDARASEIEVARKTR